MRLVPRRVAAVALVALLGACGTQYGDNGAIGGYRCGADTTGSDGSPEVDGTIDALMPSGLPASDGMHCTGKQKFSFQGRDVFLVYVGYGYLNDCPAGCFFTTMCAIYDQSQTQLYSAAVQHEGEQPNGVPTDCHTIRDGSQPSDCDYQAPGQSHPVVQTTEFQAFRDSQSHGGPLSYCFYY